MSGATILRDGTHRLNFNRDQAKSTLLNKIQQKTPASIGTAGRLLETLSTIKSGDANNTTNSSLKTPGLKGGAARRIAASTPATAMVVTPLTSRSAIRPEWEKEKQQLLAQIASLQIQLNQAQHNAMTSTTTESSEFASWKSEKEQLEQACCATQELLESTRSQLTDLQQLFINEQAKNVQLSQTITQMETKFAAQSHELTSALKKIATYEAQAIADTESDRSITSQSDNSSMGDESPKEVVTSEPNVMKQTVQVSPETNSTSTPAAEVVPFSTVIEFDLQPTASEPIATPSTSIIEDANTADTPIMKLPAALTVFSPLTEPIVAVPTESATTLLPSETEQDFAPVTTEEMEASLGHVDVFGHEQDESAHSINLSLNSSTLSPRRATALASEHPLPASFLSPKDDIGGDNNTSGFFSPIARSTPPATSTTTAAVASLTASALKIQALFRGRMERGYIAHERNLSSLPLTSPSTPSHGATPKAKRQKMSLSPIAMKSMVQEEDENVSMNDVSAAATERELSFGEEKEDEAASSGDAIAPVVAQPLSPVDAKRLSSEFKSHRPTLGSLDACWTIRSKAMNRVEELVRSFGPHGLSAWPGWKDELQHLQRGMGVQLSDLRSSILREACRLLIALAEANPKEFEDTQLAFYAPLLWKSLYVTIKIISTTADETMTEIVARVATVKSIPLFLTGLTDVHSVVREKVGSYLLQILSVSSSADLDAHLPALITGLKQGVSDSDAKARAIWRQCFEGMRKHFPGQMQTVLESLPGTVQKAIEADRKTKTNTKGAALKRKK